ncbi:MAG: integrase [Gemmataceae bacterium]|nr:integrase [Gemmataceae bacterium]
MTAATRAPRKKPTKPYPDFPLFPHANGLWSKKIKGRLYYFGAWADPEAALQKFVDQREDLYAGRSPRAKDDGLRIADLCNRFMMSKRRVLDTGEIVTRTFEDYFRTCERIVRFFGRDRRVDDIGPDDFERFRAEMAKTRGPVALGSEVTRIRVVMKYAFDQGLIAGPVRYGQSFRKPSKKVLLQNRNARGPRMFEAPGLRKLIKAARGPMKAMILLGINCGFGPTDLARLKQSNLNLKTGWVDYPRPKTGIHRRCPLWSETIAALKETVAKRPEPKDPAHAELVFVTRYGQTWQGTGTGNAVTCGFRELIVAAELYRPGLGFYALRHGFETIGGDSRDQVAVDHIMGHSRNDMASVYRERISDERLQRVTDHVRKWLFPRASVAR